MSGNAAAVGLKVDEARACAKAYYHGALLTEKYPELKDEIKDRR